MVSCSSRAGVTQDNAVITNQGYAFDPTSDAWSPLPNSNNTLYRGGSTCGFYKVGGNPGGFGAPPMASSEVLPGFVDCGQTADVSWLSVNPTTLTIAAGASATFTVAVNANVPDITQPGTYTAAVTVGVGHAVRGAGDPGVDDGQPAEDVGQDHRHRQRAIRPDRRRDRPDQHVGDASHAQDRCAGSLRLVARRP